MNINNFIPVTLENYFLYFKIFTLRVSKKSKLYSTILRLLFNYRLPSINSEQKVMITRLRLPQA